MGISCWPIKNVLVLFLVLFTQVLKKNSTDSKVHQATIIFIFTQFYKIEKQANNKFKAKKYTGKSNE